MRCVRFSGCLIGLLLGWPVTAGAVPYAYDFSTFAAPGQSFENVTLGVMTLSSESLDLKYTDLFGGGIGTEDAGMAGGSTADIYLRFSAPINSISVRAGDGSGDLDAFSLYFYEFGTSAFLGRFDSPVFSGYGLPDNDPGHWWTLDVSLANVGHVLFDPGNNGTLPGTLVGSGGVVITDIGFNTSSAPIPEPGTLVLLGAGLLGLALSQRKRLLR